MQSSSFAPLLSATFSRVSCWTNLLRLLHDFDHAPALVLGDRARLHDPDQVAEAANVLLVVHLEADPALDRLLVERVLGQVGDLHHHRLLHLVRDHVTGPDLPGSPGFHNCLAHFSSLSCDVPGDSSSSSDVWAVSASSSSSSASAIAAGATAAVAGAASASSVTRPSSRWRMEVRIRAMSWRTLRICR